MIKDLRDIMSQEVYDLKEQGVLPGDPSAASKFNEFMAAHKGKTGIKLVFSPGSYDLYGSTNGGELSCYFDISGINGLEIDGNGARLIGHDFAQFFRIQDCSNLIIKDLEIDMDPLPVSYGQVISLGQGYFDLQLTDGQKARSGLKAEAYYTYDPELMHGGYRGKDVYQFDERRMTEALSDDVLRVHAKQLPDMNEDLVIRHQVYAYNAIHLLRCDDALIDGVAVFAAAGMGIRAEDSENVTVRHFKVQGGPERDRWMSTTADASHYIACRGTVTVEDSYFEGMGDDAANVHLMYQRVTGFEGNNSIRVMTRARGIAWIPEFPPRPGDIIEFGDHQGSNPLLPYASMTVASVQVTPEMKELVISFTESVPESVKLEDICWNLSAAPKVRIRNCTIRGNRARGILLQSRDVEVADCHFQDITGAALHISCDANYWNEGLGTRDVRILNNTFEHCNFGTARRTAALDVFAEVGESLSSAGVHRDILIEGNTFVDIDGSAININSAENVEIRKNRISRFRDNAFYVDNSRNVKISANEVSQGMGSALVCGKSADNVQSDLGVEVQAIL